MLDLMAVGQGDGPMPLYMHTVKRILRDMRIVQQATAAKFDYQDFKERLLSCALTPAQLEPLTQRLETLESFMPERQVLMSRNRRKNPPKLRSPGWEPVVRSPLSNLKTSC